MPTPMMVYPFGILSKVIVAITGVAGETDFAPLTASDASRRSVIVSTHRRSTPAPASADTCSRKLFDIVSSSRVPYGFNISPRGPQEPETYALPPAAFFTQETAIRLICAVC